MSAPILLCTATWVEAQACRAGIRRAFAKQQFEILCSGMGAARAHHRLQERLQSNTLPKPRMIISTGFAGSWSPGELAPGDWVIGQSLRTEYGEKQTLSELQSSLDSFARSINAMQKRCVPVDVLSLNRPRSEVSAEPTPLIVDLESMPWARLAQKRNIPFQILRVISDTPEFPLPAAFEHFGAVSLTQNTREKLVSIGQGIKQSLKEPHVVSQFLWRSISLPKFLSSGWAELATQPK